MQLVMTHLMMIVERAVDYLGHVVHRYIDIPLDHTIGRLRPVVHHYIKLFLWIMRLII